MRRLLIFMLLALSISAGCRGKQRTALVVEVDSNMAVPGELDNVDIAVTANGKTQHMPYSLKGGNTLPLRTALVEAADNAGTLDIVATGSFNGNPVVHTEAVVGFVGGQTLLLKLFLAAECRVDPCATYPTKTCTAGGACVEKVRSPSSLTPFDPSKPALHVDAAVTQTKDSGLPDNVAGADSTPPKTGDLGGDTSVVHDAATDTSKPDTATDVPYLAGDLGGGGTGGGAGTGGTTSAGGAQGTGGMAGVTGTVNAGGNTGAGGIAVLGGMMSTGGTAGASGTTSTGGYTGAGGIAGLGGMTSTGGTMGAGGSRNTGGTVATGGFAGSGGNTGSGGIWASGGAIITGGATVTGGTTGIGGLGGASQTGGTSGTGGTSTGGSSGTGGSCAGAICGGTCTNLTTDPNNCGGCGITCSSGQSCSNSVCTCSIQSEQCPTGTQCNATNTSPALCCPPGKYSCLDGSHNGCVANCYTECGKDILVCGVFGSSGLCVSSCAHDGRCPPAWPVACVETSTGTPYYCKNTSPVQQPNCNGDMIQGPCGTGFWCVSGI